MGHLRADGQLLVGQRARDALARPLPGPGGARAPGLFFERDVPYYAAHRDLDALPGGDLCLYRDWPDAVPLARRHLDDADVAIVTSYCPDGPDASAPVLDSRAAARAFYDLDTPVTLGRLREGLAVAYLPPRGLGDFDVVLSYTGGAAIDELRSRLGARRVVPIYGSVDPAVHRPTAPLSHYRADLSYLGAYAEDRQGALEGILIEPARRLSGRRFVIGGAQYPAEFPWSENIYFVRHLPPDEHSAFFSSSRMTLNVTRRAMAEMGFCSSGRLFEAAACGVPILSDGWEGLDTFFEPDSEILVATTPEEAVAAIEQPDAALAALARAARSRALDEYTADRRARDLEAAVDRPAGVVGNLAD